MNSSKSEVHALEALFVEACGDRNSLLDLECQPSTPKSKSIFFLGDAACGVLLHDAFRGLLCICMQIMAVSHLSNQIVVENRSPGKYTMSSPNRIVTLFRWI